MWRRLVTNTGRRLSHVYDPVAESASKCIGFALWREKFDDFSSFVVALRQEAISYRYTVRGRHYFQSFDIFDQHLALHVKHYRFTRSLPELATLSDHMEHSPTNQEIYNFYTTAISSELLQPHVFFLVIIQCANCGSYRVADNRRCWFTWDVRYR